MALYRNISISFWTDLKVNDDFTPEDRYFFLYLLTNPHTNICGCYEISIKQMGRETGYNDDTVKRLIQRMEKVHKVIEYDYKTQEVFVYNWSKYNWSKSEKLAISVKKVSERIKTQRFKDNIIKLINKEIKISDLQYTVIESDTVSDTVSESDIDTDTDVSIGYRYGIDTVSIPQKKRFVKPTLEEIKAYCQERRNGISAERFFDYYESNGWKVGGKGAMKDWKAAVRNWEKNNYSSDKQEVPNDIDKYNVVINKF